MLLTKNIDQLDYTQIELIWTQVISTVDDDEKTLFANELLELESQYAKELSTIRLEE